MRRFGASWIAASLLLLACSSGRSTSLADAGRETASGIAGAGSGGANGDGGTGRGAGGATTGGAATGGGSTGTGGGSVAVIDAGMASGGSSTGSNPPDPGGIDCRADGDGTTTLVFVNGCDGTVAYRGSDIAGDSLEPGAFVCVDIGTDTETLSAKRYWGWIGEDSGAEHYTLAEFTFNTEFNDFDWYNISHVDAHNLPMQIVPVARPSCDTLTCAESWLDSCPPEGRFTDSTGAVVACVSPERDDGQSPVALFFEACDEAYAWSGDDQNGDDPSPVRACAGEDWDIVFCPGEE